MRRAGIVVTMLTVATALAVVAPGAGLAKQVSAKSSTPTVDVGDNFYSKTQLNLKVRKNKSKQVKFHWLNANSQSHNVVLTKGPKNLTKAEKKTFKSATGTHGIRFNPKFKKTGTYKFHCSIHPDVMKLEVKVARKH